MPIETIIPEVRPPQQVKIEPERPVEQLKVAPAKFEIPIKVNPLKPEGMAKNAPEPVKEQAVQRGIPSAPAQNSTMTIEWNGVPLEMARYFNVEITKADKTTMEKLKAISDWTKEGDTASFGDRLVKLQRLETKLGVPNFYESRVDKTWKYIRMDLHIKELQKRQKAGGGI